ncbi:MAG: phosphoglycolate phosphatase [Sphingomonadaceae bacterium]|uniref:phosphoglycolate phosphatase n=1 Tax=Thermaurantiacus sp. TaxID=2820283 RepID=UPI00298F25A2|nr:phosphoglycolate phosphatase [Thermaurantiacus sp.]MCS6987330.1 phosphoglycolate phosphatase [Sphingomonadaceae bacterium]MDW8414551.1 phosphoglycolate phosphatase [Thermaurantiacus sp.]
MGSAWPTTVVFDLDGTLVDTAPDLAAALNHALAVLGRPPVAPASVRTMVGRGARALLERGLATTGGASPELVEAGLDPFLDHYRAHIARLSRPFPGVEPTLDRLAAAGRRLAVCTNKPEALTHALLAKLGWTGRFAAVLGADSRPFRKPDPRHLWAAIEAAGGSPADAVFVGDTAVDLATARAAGVRFVLAAFGYLDDPVEPLGPDASIAHMAELIGALGELASRVQRSLSPPA